MDTIDKLIVEFFPDKPVSLWQRKLINWLLGVRKMTPVLQRTGGTQGLEWINSVADLLNVHCITDAGEYDNIPEKGAVVVVANHPTVIDGLAVVRNLQRVRKDVKIVVNQVLTILFPQLKDITIGIRNMQGKMARSSLKEMNDHLKQGGVLIIFPAGRLANLTAGGLKESPWQEGFLRLAIKHKAALLPIHITGSNSVLYYLAASVWRPLSNLMICREFLRHHSRKLRIKICQQIEIPNVDSAEKITEFVINCRKHLLLAGRDEVGILPIIPPVARPEKREDLVDAIDKCRLLQTFSDGKKLLLYRYQGEHHTAVLNELGRLREISFRETGAGTGKKRDNDCFDLQYYHIFVWDSLNYEIAGAYRLILAGEQIKRHGVEGLYSYSLFNYKPDFIPQLGKSIEIGRGFIQKRYQKSKVLDSLWKGIFKFISDYPDYKYLIGVLTIPKTYSCHTQQLIVAFYQHYFSAGTSVFTSSNHYKSDAFQFDEFFSGEDFVRDWDVLNRKIKESGEELPWPYKQAAKWFNPGGSNILGFVEDKSFNSITGLNFSEINELRKSYYSHYIRKQLAHAENTVE